MSEISTEHRADIGSFVELELLSRSGEHEHLTFDFVADELADYQAGFLGASTPLAQAILGERIAKAIIKLLVNKPTLATVAPKLMT